MTNITERVMEETDATLSDLFTYAVSGSYNNEIEIRGLGPPTRKKVFMDKKLEKFVKKLIKVPLANTEKTLLLQHEYLSGKSKGGNSDSDRDDYGYEREGDSDNERDHQGDFATTLFNVRKTTKAKLGIELKARAKRILPLIAIYRKLYSALNRRANLLNSSVTHIE